MSELKRLAAPASVDSIPSSAMQEDHVSMGWSAARKLRRAIDGLSRVLAIELLTAARGAGPARARSTRPPPRPPSSRRCARGSRARARTAIWAPRSTRRRRLRRRPAQPLAAAETVTGPLS